MDDAEEVKERIKGFIVKTSPGARKGRIGNDDPLLESGILDSLGVLDLIALIEAAFQIGFDDDELVPENFESVTRLAACIERKRTAQSGRLA